MGGQTKTLILTGASRGIGHATAKEFERQGWRVITCSRRAFSHECPWSGGPDNHIQIDLGDAGNRAAGVDGLRAKLEDGALHALVNNAAISPKAADGGRLGALDTSMGDWMRVFQVNFFAPMVLATELIEELRAGRGSIVNVTSIAGGRVHRFAGSAYATSKAALAALTREMAADFGPLGVRVNAIAPGEINTPILSPGTEGLLKDIPMGRLGTPEEVARTIFFLCGGDSSYMTGAEVHINGGEHV